MHSLRYSKLEAESHCFCFYWLESENHRKVKKKKKTLDPTCHVFKWLRIENMTYNDHYTFDGISWIILGHCTFGAFTYHHTFDGISLNNFGPPLTYQILCINWTILGHCTFGAFTSAFSHFFFFFFWKREFLAVMNFQ